MLSVAAYSAYPLSAPGARVRVAGFSERLRDFGVDLGFQPSVTEREYAVLTSSSSPLRKARILAAAGLRPPFTRRDADLTLVHRLGFFMPIPGIDPPKQLDLYDFDDALYLGSIGAANRLARPLKREGGRWRAYVRRARVVLAGSPHLAAHARRETSRPVEVVPSCVEPGDYRLHRHDEISPVTAGWIGSPSTTPYRADVFSAFERMNRNETVARLLVVGGTPQFEAPWLEVRPWDLDRMASDVDEFDIGLMPMPDTEWARGKCGYKLLQYFAAGIPSVASPVGVARQLVGGDRGLLASNRDEWVRLITDLANDTGARREIGGRARSFVEREYSYARWTPELARLITDLI